MRGNTFGKLFSLTTFGESHGDSVGVVIDGMPSGVKISQTDLQDELDRRRPGRIIGTTSRDESDQAIVLSGVMDDVTLGTPIAVIIKNQNQRSSDYDSLKNETRFGHADQAYLDKFGIRDHRGGGRSSGRETIARVIAGYFAGLIIPETKVKAFVSKLGPFIYKDIPDDLFDKNLGDYSFPDSTKNEEIKNFLLKLKEDGNSVGGKVVIVVKNPVKGLGEPAFDKLKSDLAKSLMSIGAVTSFSYGLGEDFSEVYGKDLVGLKNPFGGILGGISSGEDIVMTVTIKPTSTIGDKAKEGRHDPCIIPRAIPVLESMVKIVLADHLLRQKAYQ